MEGGKLGIQEQDANSNDLRSYDSCIPYLPLGSSNALAVRYVSNVC